ncbi:2-dehydro-3-deoxygluconokinase [Paenibacillus sp. JCM 10914]|uniref:sugar kinase n=1 Tax=Paenibacillus sp. JCM 10914 TaxID=1236974 RepID=UPI0003CC29FF|nr:sugar kinase [Paenibacillus sp. JCM 10914]GAE07078.1 2-dehydro-3-deoxygluconate kinase [Paenibacillus sp. JCM 10914]
MYPELVTIGETMVVFEAAADGPLRYTTQFNKRHGGAESNVAIGAARLGRTAGWISKVGDEELGKYLVSSIRGEGVDTSRVIYDSHAATGLFIKEKIREGSTQVYYYRSGSAASRMTLEEIDWHYVKQAKILHLTGITPFLSSNCLEIVHEAIRIAKENGILFSFDPNLRFKLMEKVPDAKEILLDIAKQADILMPGLDEAEYLLGTDNYDEIAAYFLNAGISKIAIKNGSVGTYYHAKDEGHGFVPSQKVERVTDPVGAGDGFAAGLLTGLLENKSLKEAVELGSIVGAMVVTVKGDVEGLPDRASIESFSHRHRDILR